MIALVGYVHIRPAAFENAVHVRVFLRCFHKDHLPSIEKWLNLYFVTLWQSPTKLHITANIWSSGGCAR